MGDDRDPTPRASAVREACLTLSEENNVTLCSEEEGDSGLSASGLWSLFTVSLGGPVTLRSSTYLFIPHTFIECWQAVCKELWGQVQ